MSGVTIMRAFRASDATAIDLQPVQAMEPGGVDLAWGEALAADGHGWTAERDGRVIGCGGLIGLYPQTALAVAAFASGIGAAMVTISRQARRTLAASPWPRIEALVRADCPEALEWAAVIGMQQCAVLRRWGPNAQDHVLFEVIRS